MWVSYKYVFEVSSMSRVCIFGFYRPLCLPPNNPCAGLPVHDACLCAIYMCLSMPGYLPEATCLRGVPHQKSVKCVFTACDFSKSFQALGFWWPHCFSWALEIRPCKNSWEFENSSFHFCFICLTKTLECFRLVNHQATTYIKEKKSFPTQNLWISLSS